MAKYNLVILGQETGGNTKNETDRLLSESGDLSASFAYRAYMKFNQNKFMESILDYDTAILLDRNNPELYLNRGLVLEKTDSLDAALRDYLIAGTIAPDLDKVYYAQGNIWYKLNNYSKSITLYSRAISLNPGNGYAYYNRALSYYKISSLHNACYDAEKARDLGVNEAQEFINNACSGKN